MFIEADFLTRPSERAFSGPYVDNVHALNIRSGAVRNRYRGRSLPFEPNYLNAIRLILEDVKPQIVVEFGALEGGLTEYVGDCLSPLDYEYAILAFDLAGNPTSRLPVKNAEFLVMDPCVPVVEMEANLPSAELRSAPLVVLHNAGDQIIEDAQRLESLLKPGDILVTTMAATQADHDLLMNWANGRYLVMSRLCDLFGDNNIQNPNGFLIKV